jgi:predicted dehydrogenase
MMLKKIKNSNKVCLVGSGQMSNAYAEVIKKTPQLSLFSVVSKNFHNAKVFAKKHNILAFKTLKDLKSSYEPEIIIVCVTPIELIKVIDELLIFKNSQIFLEKPIGINYDECKNIFKILKKKKNFFSLLNRRFYQSTIKAKKIIDKDIGQKRYIVINNYHNFLHGAKKGFRGSNLKFWPYMNSIHLLDYLFIFARSKMLSATKIFEKKIDKRRRILSYKFSFSSGDIAIYNTHFNIDGFWSVTIHTKKQLLELKPLERLIQKKKNIAKKIALSSIDRLHKPGLYYMIQNLVLKKNNKNLFNFNISHSKKLMKLINIIYKV